MIPAYTKTIKQGGESTEKVLRPYGFCISDCGLTVCTHHMPKAYLYKQMAFETHRKNLIAGFVDAMRFVSIIQ